MMCLNEYVYRQLQLAMDVYKLARSFIFNFQIGVSSLNIVLI